jgi:hypothetical protein
LRENVHFVSTTTQQRELLVEQLHAVEQRIRACLSTDADCASLATFSATSQIYLNPAYKRAMFMAHDDRLRRAQWRHGVNSLSVPCRSMCHKDILQFRALKRIHCVLEYLNQNAFVAANKHNVSHRNVALVETEPGQLFEQPPVAPCAYCASFVTTPVSAPYPCEKKWASGPVHLLGGSFW